MSTTTLTRPAPLRRGLLLERLTEDQFRAVLKGESAELAWMREVLRRVPFPPHCRLCAAPFKGPGAFVLARSDSRGRLGSRAILEHDGLDDKLVGDEIIGLFFGASQAHDTRRPHRHPAGRAASSCRQASRRCSGSHSCGGCGAHGIAYVGTTGPEGAVTDFTALGDAVNTTAPVASAAAARL